MRRCDIHGVGRDVTKYFPSNYIHFGCVRRKFSSLGQTSKLGSPPLRTRKLQPLLRALEKKVAMVNKTKARIKGSKPLPNSWPVIEDFLYAS